jgi:hypothetical protein
MNPEDIEQLKSQIDDLNTLLSEVVEPQSDQSRRRERLAVLLLKLQDGQLDQRVVRRLEKWLLADPDSLEYYVDFMSLCALLRLHFSPDLSGKFVPELANHS